MNNDMCARERTLKEVLSGLKEADRQDIINEIALRKEQISLLQSEVMELEHTVKVFTKVITDLGQVKIDWGENYKRTKAHNVFSCTYKNLSGDVHFNTWRPISFYFSEKGEHDWALVQFEEKESTFIGIPHLCEWRKSGKFGEGWYSQDGEDNKGTFEYLNKSCIAIAFFEWPECSIGIDKEYEVEKELE